MLCLHGHSDDFLLTLSFFEKDFRYKICRYEDPEELKTIVELRIIFPLRCRFLSYAMFDVEKILILSLSAYVLLQIILKNRPSDDRRSNFLNMVVATNKLVGDFIELLYIITKKKTVKTFNFDMTRKLYIFNLNTIFVSTIYIRQHIFYCWNYGLYNICINFESEYHLRLRYDYLNWLVL